MKSNRTEKPFDCVKWTRETRDRINEKLAAMSPEECLEWLNRRPTDSFLAKLWDRRKPPRSVERTRNPKSVGAAADANS